VLALALATPLPLAVLLLLVAVVLVLVVLLLLVLPFVLVGRRGRRGGRRLRLGHERGETLRRVEELPAKRGGNVSAVDRLPHGGDELVGLGACLRRVPGCERLFDVRRLRLQRGADVGR
jgi:hypothetical protein